MDDSLLPMTDVQTRALTKSRSFLVKNLTLANITDDLVSKGMFTDAMLEEIEVEKTKSSKIRRLLTDLARQPKSSYRKFIELLQDSSEGHCAAEILKKEEEALEEERSHEALRLRQRRVPARQSVPTGPSQALAQHSSSSQVLQEGLDCGQFFLKPFVGKRRSKYQMAPTGMPQNPFNPMPSPSTSGSGSSSSIALISSTSTSTVFSTASQETGYQDSRSELTTGLQEAAGVPGPRVAGESREIEMMELSDDELDLTSTDDISAVQQASLAAVPASVDSRPSHPLAPSSSTSSFSSTSSTYELRRSQSENKVYKHDSNPRGAALIIDNSDFAILDAREGSDVDRQRLQTMLHFLGYEVTTRENLTAIEMKREIEAFARVPVLKDVDSCVVAILSHGEDGEKIFGTDGLHTGYESNGYITVRQIQDILNSQSCPALKCKPKLIIVQACRGANEDISLPTSTGGASGAGAGSGGVRRDVTREPDQGSLRSQSSLPSQTRQHPMMADFIVLYPTCPGFVAYRHIRDGSPFIKALTETFTSQAADCHITEMVTEVNRILAEEFDNPYGYLTVSSNANQLLRQWFLNPPFPGQGNGPS